MAKKKRANPLRAQLAKKGLKMPHGYKVVARKERKKGRKKG